MKAGLRAIHTPAFRWIAAFAFGLLALALATGQAKKQWRTTPALAVGMSLQSPEGTFTIEPLDLTAEPGEIGSDEDLARFYARQGSLEDILSAGMLDVRYEGKTLALQRQQSPVSELPLAFWIQVAVGIGALLISAWVWALKSQDLANRLFALSGLATLLFTFSAAIYTTRETALDPAVFQNLVAVNVFGAALFGTTVLSLFVVYPLRLRHWRLLLLTQTLFFGLWTALSISELLPAALGVNLITLVEMIGICLAVGAQYFATRKDPRARASLIWVGLSVTVGAGAFIVLNAYPLVRNQEAQIAQAYGFLFFLLIYIGIAAGLRRFRLFEIGEWSYRFFFYAAGVVLIVALDALLLSFAGLERISATGVELVILAFVYLPLRDTIWRRLGRKGRMETHELLAQTLHVAFASSSRLRASRWEDLLKEAFDPLEITEADDPVNQVKIAGDGLALLIPAVMDSPALRIAYPWKGRSLFNESLRKLAEQVVLLVREAEASRESYDRGVAAERQRMAQDLHDDIGARLLSGLYRADEELKPTFQAALAEIRDIVRETPGEKIPLSRLMAEVRSEAAQRLSGANIDLDWPLEDGDEEEAKILDHRQHKALRSALREVVSNVIRHSGASGLKVRVASDRSSLAIRLADNGRGFTVDTQHEGFGLKNMRRRFEGIGGTFRLESQAGGSAVHLSLPLEATPTP